TGCSTVDEPVDRPVPRGVSAEVAARAAGAAVVVAVAATAARGGGGHARRRQWWSWRELQEVVWHKQEIRTGGRMLGGRKVSTLEILMFKNRAAALKWLHKHEAAQCAREPIAAGEREIEDSGGQRKAGLFFAEGWTMVWKHVMCSASACGLAFTGLSLIYFAQCTSG
ncbi:unnamed protein product, partial [Phaeothamnion confervicola]